MAKLLVTEGSRRLVIELDDVGFTVGRDPGNSLSLQGGDVSRNHCQIKANGEAFLLDDLGSKNGTLVNGVAVRRHVLHTGDRIRVGDAQIVFVDGEDTDLMAFLAMGSVRPSDTPASYAAVRQQVAGQPPVPLAPVTDEDETVRRISLPRKGDKPGDPVLGRSIQDQLLRLALLAQTISGELDLNRLLGTILDTLLSFTALPRGMLLLLDEDRQLRPRVVRSHDGSELDESAWQYSRALTNEAIRQGSVATLEDLDQAGLASGESTADELGITAALCMPLLVSGRFHGALPSLTPDSDRRRAGGPNVGHVLGAIYLESRSADRLGTKVPREILQHAASQAAIAIQNARLYQQATTDPVTGLYNRGYFEQLLEEEIRLGASSEGGFALLLSDIDHFKLVNDNHGHPVGDEVLRAVSLRARQILRTNDVAGRYGGEEFVFVLPDTSLEDAVLVARKIRSAVSEMTFSVSGLVVRLSIGISHCPEMGREAAALIKRADQALYHAKETGRDREVVWQESLDRAGRRADPLAGILSGNLARDHRNVQILLETIDIVRTGDDFQSVIELALDKVLEFTGAARALLFRGQSSTDLRLIAARASGGQAISLGEVAFSKTAPARAVSEGRSFCLLDSAQDLSDPFLRSSSIESLALKTVMCSPLEVRDQVVGAIYVDDTVASKEFSQADVVFFEAIAKQVGMAMAATFASSVRVQAPAGVVGPAGQEMGLAMQHLQSENAALRDRLRSLGQGG